MKLIHKEDYKDRALLFLNGFMVFCGVCYLIEWIARIASYLVKQGIFN